MHAFAISANASLCNLMNQTRGDVKYHALDHKENNGAHAVVCHPHCLTCCTISAILLHSVYIKVRIHLLIRMTFVISCSIRKEFYGKITIKKKMQLQLVFIT